ncbi:MAG: superoxide dismutase [Pseudomonas fluorescens]|nr:MAG: superoxide dismutase [Pseudomonas fluorescens]
MLVSGRHLLIGSLVIVPVAAVAAVVTSSTDPAAKAEPVAMVTAKATLFDLKGKNVGNAVLTQTPEGVQVAVAAMGLPAGELAMHIHEKGVCDPKAKFTTAGAHFNPMGKQHGLNHEGGAHAGDMPNITVGTGGKAEVSTVNHQISLVKGVPNSVLDADGSALIIHAKPDDNVSQPAGDAGDRIVCGVIKAG